MLQDASMERDPIQFLDCSGALSRIIVDVILALRGKPSSSLNFMQTRRNWKAVQLQLVKWDRTDLE